MTRSKFAALAAVLALGAFASACRADVAVTVSTTLDPDAACVASAVAASPPMSDTRSASRTPTPALRSGSRRISKPAR